MARFPSVQYGWVELVGEAACHPTSSTQIMNVGSQTQGIVIILGTRLITVQLIWSWGNAQPQLDVQRKTSGRGRVTDCNLTPGAQTRFSSCAIATSIVEESISISQQAQWRTLSPS